MGNKPVSIGLKTEKTTYEAGSVIKGRVYVKVASNSKEPVTGIHLVLAGEECVFLSVPELIKSNAANTIRSSRSSSSSNRRGDDEGHRQQQQLQQQQDGFLKRRKKLKKMLKSVVKLIWVDVPMAQFQRPLPAGEYEYPFEWELPQNLSPSLFLPSQGRSAGIVRYNLSTWFSTGKTHANGAPYLPHQSVTQKIQIMAAPSSAMNPITNSIQEEDLFPIASCFCFKKGKIRLGFQLNRGHVVAPGSRLEIAITGKNFSAVPVTQIEVMVVERIKWTAQNRTLENTSILAREIISTLDLPPWKSNPVVFHQDDELLARDATVDPLPVRLWVPSTARLSYSGKLIEVSHTLVIRAVTLWYSSTPTLECPIKVGMVRDDPGTTTTAAAAVVVDETPAIAATTGLASLLDPPIIPMVDEVVILPNDWRGQAAEMIFIPPDMVSVDSYVPVAPTAPDESLLDFPVAQGQYGSTTNVEDENGVAPCDFTQLQAFLSNVRQLEDLPNLLPRNPSVLARVRRLTPPQYVDLVCGPDSHRYSHSSSAGAGGNILGRKASQKKVNDLCRGRMLASAMADNFQCRHVLAILWACPDDYRLDILRDVAPLASDWNQQRQSILRELEPEEADYARSVLQW